MSLLSENLRYLRAQLGKSQLEIAESLIITRARYSKYEDGHREPPVQILLSISRYYHISIDLLLSIDLRRYPLKEILELPDNRILLPVKVDRANGNVIEIIPHKASMGYLNGYSDPEYIENLQTMSLPFLRAGNYRAFPAEGDSMPPHKHGSYIIGKYVEHIGNLKEGKTYVFVTRSEGITYKRLTKKLKESLIVSADNSLYVPYEVPLLDILEVWEYACSFATEEFSKDDFVLDSHEVLRMLKELKVDMEELKSNNPK